MLPRSRRESQTFGWPEPGTPDAGFGGGAAASKNFFSFFHFLGTDFWLSMCLYIIGGYFQLSRLTEGKRAFLLLLFK